MAASTSPSYPEGDKPNNDTRKAFSTLPSGAAESVTPFTINIREGKIEQFKKLLELSDIGPWTYWNTKPFEAGYGVTYEWLQNAKDTWQYKWDWRQREARLNDLPQFEARLTDRHGEEIDIHFMALFSKNPKAVPILFIHGWPGSFLEYVGMCEILRTRYTPETLPYHVIVPCLPGYGFSSGPSLERRHHLTEAADIMNRLMIVIGLDKIGYIASGGDAGAFVARILAAKYPECIGLHLTNTYATPPKDEDLSKLTDDEKGALKLVEKFYRTGTGYSVEHGTKPATIGFALQNNPIGILAWVGEKYQLWSDETPLLEKILDSAFLYFVTSTMARSLWIYVEFFNEGPLSHTIHGEQEYYCHKPFANSFFPKEMGAVPEHWAARTGNLVYYGRHKKGGHFAALEEPEAFLGDIEEFVRIAFSEVKKE